MGNPGTRLGTTNTISPRLLEYMRQHPNEAIYITAIATELGLNPGSVATAMGRFANTEGVNIHHVYRDGKPLRGLYIYSNHDVTDNSPAERKPKVDYSDVPFPNLARVKTLIDETEAVSAYPPELDNDPRLMVPAEYDKVEINTAYGRRETSALNVHGMLYEYIGDTKVGTPMVRDESGRLYMLKEV